MVMIDRIYEEKKLDSEKLSLRMEERKEDRLRDYFSSQFEGYSASIWCAW